MKILKISNKDILLDDDDYEIISKMTGWYVHHGGNSRTPYVVHDKYGRLHRFLLKITDEDLIVDHIDRNGLNNQRKNLRIVSNQINKRNQNTCSDNKFNFNGIAYEPQKGTHSARVRVTWSEYDREENNKRNKRRSKSFSISKYGLEQAIKLAVLTRIEKMREFDYFIDERSETIEKEIKENQLNIDKILNIDLFDFLE